MLYWLELLPLTNVRDSISKRVNNARSESQRKLVFANSNNNNPINKEMIDFIMTIDTN